MIVNKHLVIAAGGIFCLLGVLHAIFTAGDLLDPVDPDLIARMRSTGLRLSRNRTNMWDAWLGFNLSHALGLVVFGVVCITTSAKPWLLVIIAAIYLILAVRFWFYAPAILTGWSLVFFVLALRGVRSSSRSEARPLRDAT